MITLQNQCTAIVGLPSGGGELTFTNSGTWFLANIQSVAGYTNAPVDVSTCRDGSVVIVDAFGSVFVVPGPDLSGAGVYGMWLASLTVGTFLAVRYVVRFMHRSAGLPSSGGD